MRILINICIHLFIGEFKSLNNNFVHENFYWFCSWRKIQKYYVCWEQTCWNWFLNLLVNIFVSFLSVHILIKPFSERTWNWLIIVLNSCLTGMTNLLDFELEKQCIDIFYSENFLVFLKTYRSTTIWSCRKRISDPCKGEEIWEQLQNQLIFLVWKQKT